MISQVLVESYKVKFWFRQKITYMDNFVNCISCEGELEPVTSITSTDFPER